MIYYIFHSSFLIELKKYILIFDFYKFPLEEYEKKFIEKFIKRKDKKILIFSSHSHQDHFNSKIFEWKKYNKNIKYILSDDIKVTKNEDMVFVSEGDILEVDKGIKIYIFGSTDLGVSFYIEIEDRTIFHSGDLHFWHWEDDTLEEEREMKSKYEKILGDVAKLPEIDFAFVPVDPRLGVNTYEGVELFFETLKPKKIIPMHFWEDYRIMKNLKNIFKNKGVEIVEIKETMSTITEI